MMKKIVCVHLLNNYSGSPKVLKQIINSFISKGYQVDLITNKSEGFLSNINGVKYIYISYQWKSSKFLTLPFLIFAQIQLFFLILISSSNNLFYINTITPIGALLACNFSRKQVICHVHEKYVKLNLFNNICEYIYKKTSCFSIFVSKYLQTCYLNKQKNSKVIYNSLELKFCNVATKHLKNRISQPTKILMICSLRKFKGVFEFIKLSSMLPQYNFELVVSSSKEEVDLFKQNNSLGSNIRIFEKQSNLHPFYQRARLLLNLSDQNLWVETFGLTILEAMTYGIPSIVPKVGGPIELVSDNYNGYLVSSGELLILKNKINMLMKEEKLYQIFSNNAILRSKKFDNDLMMEEIDILLKKFGQ